MHNNEEGAVVSSVSSALRPPAMGAAEPGADTGAPPPPLALCFDGPSVPAFLHKLYTILEDHNTDSIVSWSRMGDSVVVHKLTEFTKFVLPQFFKHSNFQSFVRQLNQYGFHKLKRTPNHHEFSHTHFKRGYKQLLAKIKRKTSLSAASARPTPSTPESPTLAQENEWLRQRCEDIGDRLEQLERQSELVMRESRVLWNEVLSVNQQHRECELKLQMLGSSVGLPNSVPLPLAGARPFNQPLVHNQLPLQPQPHGHHVHHPHQWPHHQPVSVPVYQPVLSHGPVAPQAGQLPHRIAIGVRFEPSASGGMSTPVAMEDGLDDGDEAAFSAWLDAKPSPASGEASGQP